MATKKYMYISPDSFKETTRDTFRKLMGQYWYSSVDALGISSLPYGESSEALGDNDEPISVEVNPQEIFGASSFEDKRYLSIAKVDDTSDIGEFGVSESDDSTTPEARTITLSVTAASEDYQTLTKFSSDMGLLFKNPAVDGIEDFFYEESFEYDVVDDNNKATSGYNFFVEEYESLSKSIQETVLPNFYAVSLTEYDADPSGESVDSLDLYDEIKNHSLLYNNTVLLDKLQKNGVDPDDSTTTDINEFDYSLNVPYKDYYKEWSIAYTDLDFGQTSALITEGKNAIQTYSSYKSGVAGAGANIDELNVRRAKVPFFVNLALTSEGKENVPGKGNVADILGAFSLTTTWVSHIISSLDSSLLVDPAYESEYEFISKQYYTIGGGTQSLNASPILKKGPSYKSVSRLEQESEDITTDGVFDDINSQGSFSIKEKFILDADGSEENDHAHSLNFNFGVHMIDTDFSQRLSDHQDLIHDQENSFENALLGTEGRLYNGIFQDGILSEDQTIAYRVKKHRGSSTTNVPVQDIWIPNAKDMDDIMEYIDTQVRYGEQYTYDIYAYKYVFGTRYRYKEVEAPSLDTVEFALSEDEEELIGYNFSWFGAKNLFDTHPDGMYVWQKAALDMNRVGVANVSRYNTAVYDTFRVFNHYIDEVEYPLVEDDSITDMTEWPAWSPKNTRFFFLNEIRSIMSQAWVVKPKGNGQPPGLGVGAFTYNIDFPSWHDMWGEDWDPTWVQEDIEGYDASRIDRLLRGYDPPGDFNPGDFSLDNWFQLFMGYDSGSHGWGYNPHSDEGPGYPPQPTPPSHHRLNGERFGYPTAGPQYDSDDQPIPNFELIRQRFTGLEDEGSGLVGRTTPGGGTFYILDSFHGGGLGISDVFAGEGIPLVEVKGYKAKYMVEMYPCTRIVEAPYATITTSVLSKPPPPPEVEVIPYRAVNNELLFTFDATIAEMRMVAVPLTQEDELLFEKHYQAQSVSPGGKLSFQSDDIPAFFEVFRLDAPPNSYSDFDGNKRATISTLIDNEEEIIRSRSADYVEKLQPNIKYYYTFRTVDFHGNVSNPTFIYEIELVDDGGAIYPLISIYQLPIIDNKVASKTMKKLIQIYPTLEQVTPNLPSNLLYGEDTTNDGEVDTFIEHQDPNDVGTVELGQPGLDRIWNKTFKIRLTSKKTGKKIDMNVTFKSKDERTTS